MNPRIIAVIDNVHMGMAHQGLSLLAKKFKVNLQALGQGELVLFLNRGRDKIKVMGAMNQVLGYIKMPNGRKFPLAAIQWLPQTFAGNGSINLEKALEIHVTQAMEKRTTGMRIYQ